MTMMNKIKPNLDSLQLSDVYSLMLFILYKTKDIPDYATLSELCYLLDGANLTRLLAYFAGKTVTFPTEEELTILTNALLLYQYININRQSYTDAVSKLNDLTAKQKEEVTALYVQIIDIVNNYNINREGFKKDVRC